MQLCLYCREKLAKFCPSWAQSKRIQESKLQQRLSPWEKGRTEGEKFRTKERRGAESWCSWPKQSLRSFSWQQKPRDWRNWWTKRARAHTIRWLGEEREMYWLLIHQPSEDDCITAIMQYLRPEHYVIPAKSSPLCKGRELHKHKLDLISQLSNDHQCGTKSNAECPGRYLD